jgi:hypothetical protein
MHPDAVPIKDQVDSCQSQQDSVHKRPREPVRARDFAHEEIHIRSWPSERVHETIKEHVPREIESAKNERHGEESLSPPRKRKRANGKIRPFRKSAREDDAAEKRNRFPCVANIARPIGPAKLAIAIGRVADESESNILPAEERSGREVAKFMDAKEEERGGRKKKSIRQDDAGGIAARRTGRRVYLRERSGRSKNEERTT